ncbi:MAG: nicotinate-nucleotide adenylyltransferase [Planctomycetaceae bacterium]|jgi:nicotinate-nucleotide adenylyltransferase|nr:nicotinate-nucleotide adenylyltransferase [bacterium]MDC0308446.1 nicotinate-nucleotide adenylyltransferase [Planctomycetaceae bacterium]MDG2388560.1 nicotinate-nucleotide adenylyltransferase [Planctomycetaceae bacterium]
MRLGILGGSFDPVHLGHLVMAEVCREQLNLDEVWFVPAGHPPHKTDRELAPAKARAEMLEFALAGIPEFQVSDVELKKESTSYTVETLEKLAAENLDRELFLIIGADSLQDFPNWKEPARIAELAKIVAVNRGRQDPPALEEIEQKLGSEVADRIRVIEMPGIDVSSTDIRHRIRSGHSIRFLVPKAVEAYLNEHKIYSPGE